MMKKSTVISGILAIALPLILPLTMLHSSGATWESDLILASAEAQTRDWGVVRRVQPWLPLRDATMDKVARDDAANHTESAFRITKGRTSFLLTDLNQLRGLVTIASPSDANHFARIRTPQNDVGCWSPKILEVVNKQQMANPLYSDTESLEPHRVGKISDIASGNYAILSPQAYRLGHFTPAQVVKVSGGYQITRFVCFFDNVSWDGIKIEKGREKVGRDGAYSRTILSSQPVPKLPDTCWTIDPSM